MKKLTFLTNALFVVLCIPASIAPFKATYFANDGEPHKIGTQSDGKEIYITPEHCSFEVSKSFIYQGDVDELKNQRVIDTTFGQNGTITTKMNTNMLEKALCGYGFNKIGAAILSNDKIVIVGSNDEAIFIVRYTYRGLPDGNFNNGGSAMVASRYKELATETLSEALETDEQEAQKFFNHMQPKIKHTK